MISFLIGNIWHDGNCQRVVYLSFIDFLELYPKIDFKTFSPYIACFIFAKNTESRLNYFIIYTQTTKYQGRRIGLGDGDTSKMLL